MKTRRMALLLFLLVLPVILAAQGSLDPGLLSKRATNAWPTYHGDYSGQHFSPLDKIDVKDVKGLSLAWVYHLSVATPASPAPPANAAAAGRGFGVPGTPDAAGGVRGGGRGARGGSGGGFGFATPSVKSLPLMVNGVLYLTTPGNGYAVDARSGEEIWHYRWAGAGGGGGLGNRGMAMYAGWVYMEAGNNLICLDASSGKERWHVSMAPEGAPNFSSVAPLTIRNHIIAGEAGDSGKNRSWLESHDPETGELQWRWYSTPQKGEIGFDTWPSQDSIYQGGGGLWETPTYDAQLNLLYVPTGNPTPTFDGRVRPGDNLFSDSVVALNPDTGKMVWYFQYTPHDTHDYDSAQVPVLFDGVIDGKSRKLLAQANRDGYFFVLDRITGKCILTKPFIKTVNWAKGLRGTGQPDPDPNKEPQLGGALVSPSSDGAANFEAPAFDPRTGLLYVNSTISYSLFYSAPVAGGAGNSEYTGFISSALRAIDYKTGEVKWQHDYPGGSFSVGTYPGVLSTAGRLVFAGDPVGNFIAFDAMTGKIMWHSNLSSEVTNSPITFEMDGHQYIVVAARDAIYAFYLQ